MRIFTDKYGTKYADLVIGGKRRRVSLRTKDGKVAILRAGKMADDRQATNDGKTLLAAFLPRLETYTKATRKENTQYRYKMAWRDLLNWRNFKYLDQITPAVLDDYAIYCKSQLKKPTAAGLNRKISVLKASMRQAEFWELLPPQKWEKVSKFKQKKGRIEYHTPEEISQILDIFNPAWRLVVLLGCRAGLRRGEIANLKWKDVDFENNQLYIAPNKTDTHRYIPIADDLKKALKKAYSARKKEVYVINVGDTTNRNDPNYLGAYYRKATADLPFNCFLHKLRHTFASHLVQAGIDLYRVKNLMGHSSITMTEIYAHLAPQDLKSAIKALPDIK